MRQPVERRLDQGCLARSVAPSLTVTAQATAVEQLAIEIDNVRAALAWALEHGEAVTALELATATFPLWFLRSMPSEGRPWLEAALDAAEKDGSRAKPEFGSVWWRLQGKDQTTARLHTTVAVPGATAQSMGLPDNGKMGGVWIMSAGTSTAHLMLPGQ